MDEYKAIWKLVNDKLADNEWTIGYLRGEVDRLKAVYDSSVQENICLTDEITRLNGIIAELKGEAG